jgi:hypothetical protein
LRLGAFSQDVEVFAYVYAKDWVHFLEIQEELLFKVTAIIQRAGTQLAFPSQRMYVTPVESSVRAAAASAGSFPRAPGAD